MFGRVLSESAEKSLALLGKSKILEFAYLAGGTAAALHLGHRYSYDFDFFTPIRFDGRLLVKKMLKLIPDFRIKQQKERTIIGEIYETSFSLFYYEYPILYKLHNYRGIKVLDIKDIASMKISAIRDRGLKRDFIDLYFICCKEKILTVKKAIKLFNKKFNTHDENIITILMSLVYFDDAEDSEMPEMIKPVKWSEVKKYFVEEQRKITKELIEN